MEILVILYCSLENDQKRHLFSQYKLTQTSQLFGGRYVAKSVGAEPLDMES